MNTRDYDYIEARLMDPAGHLLDAIQRLKRLGRLEEAGRLMTAAQRLNDECRAVRYALADERAREGR